MRNTPKAVALKTLKTPPPVGIKAEFASAKQTRFRQQIRRSFGVVSGGPTL